MRIWDSDRSMHILEPVGTDVAALDSKLARRFLCATCGLHTAA